MLKETFLSYIELSKKKLIHNIKQFKKLAKKGTKIAVVIKGNAYGHGQNLIVKILEPYVDYFQINSINELKLLRQVSKKRALILGYLQKIDLSQAIKLNCIIALFSIEQLSEINKVAEKFKIIQEVHIPIDAYLGREGFLFSELSEFLEKIKKCEYIKVSGIYAHFANIEDASNFKHAYKQIIEYKKALNLANSFGFKKLQTHISATSGLLVYEKGAGIHSLVRLGIGVYGMWPSERLKSLYESSKFKLKSVLSWKTRIAQIKILPKGFFVGYGLTYKTKKETKIAIIPQGYADGLERALSNKGEVLIGGTRCKIIGRVSMNMFTVDISHLGNVKVEDEVVIIGVQRKEEITTLEIAKKLNTVNYEIITHISPLLPRVII